MEYLKKCREELIEELKLLQQNYDSLEIRHKKAISQKNQWGKYYQALIEKASDGIVLIGPDGKISYASPSAFKMFGYYTNDHFPDPDESTHPEDLIMVLQTIELIIKDPSKVSTIEYRFKHRDTSWIWIESTFNNQLSEPGIESIIINFRDISERKKAEDKLRESEERFRIAAKSLIDVVFEWDLKDKLDWYGDIDSLVGYSEGTFPRTFGAWVELLHPDDRERVIDTLNDHVKNSKNYDIEYRILKNDGQWRWWSERGTPLKNGNGIPYKMVGSITDITEINRAELALQESEKNYKELINGMNETVWVLDFEGNILDVNNTAIKLLGYTKEEILEIGLFEIDSSLTKESIISLSKSMPKDKSHIFETTHKSKSGQIYPIEVYSSLVTYQGKKSILAIARDITKRKKIKEELKFQAHVLNNVGQAVIATDLLGNIIYWNNTATNLYGWTSKESVGRNIIDMIPSDQSREHAIEIMKNLVGGVAWSGEFLVKRKDGSTFPAFVTDTPIFDSHGQVNGIIGISSDLTERKKTRETILKLSRAVEQTIDTIVVTDYNGTIEYVNQAFVDLTGYSVEEVLGKTPRILKSGKQNTDYYEEMWKIILSGKPYREEIINKKKSGDLYYEEKTISPIFDDNKNITHFIATGVDITNRKLVEKELIEAKEKAEESDRLKSAFLANMSHEIRTPMNGILGFAELLKEPQLSDDQQQKYISIIEKSGSRMLNILNDIIDISKIEAGLVEVDLQEMNINEELEYLYSFFSPQVEEKGIQFHFKNHLSTQKVIIISDKKKLLSVLTNLIKNAVKFTDKGSITFGYDLIKTLGYQYLQFYVKDTGIGISKDKQESVFERFIQADISDNMAHQGAGLGLAISKAYIYLLGGCIWLESVPGKGSAFYFTIPWYSTQGK